MIPSLKMEKSHDASLLSAAELQLACDVIIEAVLFASTEPLSLNKIRDCVYDRFDTLEIEEAIELLKRRWRDRGLLLEKVASGYRFRTTNEVQIFIERSQAVRKPKYSKSVMEILAVIAYRQPVTRSDIENIRGVAVNSYSMKTLAARGWIESVGIKQNTPGNPKLWATTKCFLDDLGMQKLSELPPLDEIKQTLNKNELLNEFNLEKNEAQDQDKNKNNPQRNLPL